MAKQAFGVIGLGQFGRHLALTLTRAGAHVIAADEDMAKVEGIKDLVARAVRLDCADEAALRGAGLDKADCVVFALGEEDFEAAALGVSALARMGIPRIVSRAPSHTRGRILQALGATQVVYPELQAAEQVARTLVAPGLESALALPSGYSLASVVVPAHFVGEELGALAERGHAHATVIAVRRRVDRAGQAVETAVRAEPTLRLEDGDVLVVAGPDEAVEALGREAV
ncbi:MAG: TrkA family potassium uptake protein [Deltaproteobacteria bacterium]|nr:TrkA family potassium uptake protein [Deltaproteobacteria bacterium]